MADEKINLRNPATLMAALRGDIANALVASTPGGIEMQEAEGQKAVCSNNLFPRRFLRCEQRDFEEMGVAFVGVLDELFFKVELPNHWSIQPHAGHSMWSYLVDADGERRAAIFYKAAFYDRNAHVSLDQI